MSFVSWTDTDMTVSTKMETSKEMDVEKAISQELLEVGQELVANAQLGHKVKILCWILTYPEEHNSSCPPITETWGKRCDKLIFMSTKEGKLLHVFDESSLESSTSQ